MVYSPQQYLHRQTGADAISCRPRWQRRQILTCAKNDRRTRAPASCLRPGTDAMNDIMCGDQSTNAGTEQTEKTKYERNNDVNGTLRMLESSPLESSVAFVSGYTSPGPSGVKANAVAVATPAARTALAPRRGNIRGCGLRK